MVIPGQLCTECGEGAMHAYGSHLTADGNTRIRYYRCSICHWKPDRNKVAIPSQYAPARIRMRRPSSKLGKQRG